MIKTFNAYDGHDRRKKRPLQRYRFMTADEARELKWGDVVTWRYSEDEVLRARVAGKPKTWKTRPGDVDVTLKYGLNTYFHARFRGGTPVGTPLVVLIPEGGES